MEFTITVEDSAFEKAIRTEIGNIIIKRANVIADTVARENSVLIDEAIHRYLERNLSGDNLKRMIDSAVIEALKDKINEL